MLGVTKTQSDAPSLQVCHCEQSQTLCMNVTHVVTHSDIFYTQNFGVAKILLDTVNLFAGSSRVLEFPADFINTKGGREEKQAQTHSRVKITHRNN